MAIDMAGFTMRQVMLLGSRRPSQWLHPGDLVVVIVVDLNDPHDTESWVVEPPHLVQTPRLEGSDKNVWHVAIIDNELDSIFWNDIQDSDLWDRVAAADPETTIATDYPELSELLDLGRLQP